MLGTIALLLIPLINAATTTPPACVIAAINLEPDPSDFQTICTSPQVRQYLSDNCGGEENLQAANDFVTSVCEDHGEGFDAGGEGDGDAEGDEEGITTVTGTATRTMSEGVPTGGEGGSSATTTGSTAEQTTGGAAGLRLGMDVLGMGVLGAWGLALAL